MDDNTENDEAPAVEGDPYDDGPDAEDLGEYTRPEPYGEEPGSHEVEDAAAPRGAVVAADANPDVFLDVPVLKVEEIDLDVEDLRAHVSLQTEVLDLLRLSVGADVTLGRVHLGVSGVEAQAQLRVRLDNVAMIVDRVLTTLDRNPEILRDLARGVGSAVQDVGGGARQAVGELGTGAGRAVQDVGQGTGAAVRDVGRDVGRAVEDVGGEASRAAAGATGEDVGGVTGSVVGEAVGVTAATDEAARKGGTVRRTESDARSARSPEDARQDRTARSEGGTRKRRVRAEDGKPSPRPVRRRAADEREEPP
ncbi:hypothetical protein [Streptomyces sp. enrichment culture]|uniref:hypothetical protein n=1 Tax=Streptomyces sp. enrichment culture TaxID=1795815 RepID=UPI003F5749A3